MENRTIGAKNPGYSALKGTGGDQSLDGSVPSRTGSAKRGTGGVKNTDGSPPIGTGRDWEAGSGARRFKVTARRDLNPGIRRSGQAGFPLIKILRGPMETKPITIPEGKICDFIDQKFRGNTTEEYVRQTVEKRLINEHNYLSSQIKIEFPLALGANRPRADIVIFDKDREQQTQEHIKIIIECKAESVDIRNTKDGLE